MYRAAPLVLHKIEHMPRHERECLDTARFARQAGGVLLAGAGERQHAQAAKPATCTPITWMSSHRCAHRPAPLRAAPHRSATRVAPSLRAARCAHSHSETSSGSKKSDSAVSLDDGGTAGTVKLFSKAAPALAPVADDYPNCLPMDPPPPPSPLCGPPGDSGSLGDETISTWRRSQALGQKRSSSSRKLIVVGHHLDDRLQWASDM